jgi:excisionase family DNA binding protein
MSQTSTGLGRKKRAYHTTPVNVTPLVVSPEGAAQMLGIKVSKLYLLLKTGELENYSCGRSRRVVVASIHDYIARRLAEAAATGWQTWEHNPRSRRWREEAKATTLQKRRAYTEQQKSEAE